MFTLAEESFTMSKKNVTVHMLQNPIIHFKNIRIKSFQLKVKCMFEAEVKLSLKVKVRYLVLHSSMLFGKISKRNQMKKYHVKEKKKLQFLLCRTYFRKLHYLFSNIKYLVTVSLQVIIVVVGCKKLFGVYYFLYKNYTGMI